MGRVEQLRINLEGGVQLLSVGYFLLGGGGVVIYEGGG